MGSGQGGLRGNGDGDVMLMMRLWLKWWRLLVCLRLERELSC